VWGPSIRLKRKRSQNQQTVLLHVAKMSLERENELSVLTKKLKGRHITNGIGKENRLIYHGEHVCWCGKTACVGNGLTRGPLNESCPAACVEKKKSEAAGVRTNEGVRELWSTPTLSAMNQKKGLGRLRKKIVPSSGGCRARVEGKVKPSRVASCCRRLQAVARINSACVERVIEACAHSGSIRQEILCWNKY